MIQIKEILKTEVFMKNEKKSVNYKIAMTGAFAALSVILSVTPLGYISIGIISLTIMYHLELKSLECLMWIGNHIDAILDLIDMELIFLHMISYQEIMELMM